MLALFGGFELKIPHTTVGVQAFDLQKAWWRNMPMTSVLSRALDEGSGSVRWSD